MILSVRDITGRASLPAQGTYAYGNISIYLINALIALAQLGFPIIFLIVFGDVSGNLLERLGAGPNSFWTSRWFTQTLLGVLLFYLILKKEIQNLKYAGLVVLCLSFIFIGLLFIHFITSDPQPEETADLLDTKIDIKFFTGFPTLITSYAFQTTFFTAFASLKNKTHKNGQLADLFARIGVFIIYVTSPLLAHGLYGENIEKNLLKSISKEDGAFPVILEIIFLFIPALSIPTIFFVGKEAVLIIFDEITRKTYSRQNNEINEHNKAQYNLDSIHESASHPDQYNAQSQPDQVNEANVPERIVAPETLKETKHLNPKEYLNMKPVYYYIVTIVCYVIVVLLSIVVGDVSIFFGIIGSTAGCFVTFTGPGSFYIIAHYKEKIPLDTTIKILIYIAAWIFVVCGISASIFLNTCVILNAVL